MLRVSALTLLLLTAPAYAQQEASDFDDVLIQIFNGDEAVDEADESSDFDGDEAVVDEEPDGDVYDDESEESDEDDDEEGAEPPVIEEPPADYTGHNFKYRDGRPMPGEPGYDEFVAWYLEDQTTAYRPEGMTDGEFAEWLEAACPGDEEHVCGSPE